MAASPRDSDLSAAIAKAPQTQASHRKPFILTSDTNIPVTHGTARPAKATARRQLYSPLSQAQGT